MALIAVVLFVLIGSSLTVMWATRPTLTRVPVPAVASSLGQVDEWR